MDIEFRHLAYFVAVAEELSFNRGAQRLGLSQSTLNRQINSLESDFDLKLLDRAPTGVVLTPAGEDFLRHAREILRLHDTLVSDMRGHAGETKEEPGPGPDSSKEGLRAEP